VKYILAMLLIVCGLFVWSMMHFTTLGYNGWGVIIAPVALLSGVLVATDRS
jgi:hypothetical protein